MPSFSSRRPARRAASPYPAQARLDRAIQTFFPELPDFTPRIVLPTEPPSFLGTQGQPIDLDNPLVVSSFRPVPEFPIFHAFNPSPVHPIPAGNDQTGPASTSNVFFGFQPREPPSSPAYRDSPPSYHRDDSLVYRPMSPLFLPASPPPVVSLVEIHEPAPVSYSCCYVDGVAS